MNPAYNPPDVGSLAYPFRFRRKKAILRQTSDIRRNEKLNRPVVGVTEQHNAFARPNCRRSHRKHISRLLCRIDLQTAFKKLLPHYSP